MSDLSREMRRYPTYLPTGLHTEEIADEIERLEADLALLRPVCSAPSGGLVEGFICPTCKGHGVVAALDGGKHGRD